MTLRCPILLLAAVLAVVAAGASGARAGSGDVHAILTAATNYKVAASNGSPAACQMVTPNGAHNLIEFARMLAPPTSDSCPAAVKALATFYASKSPSRQAYVHSNELKLKAIARGTPKVHGSRATLKYSIVEGGAREFFSSDFELMHGHWLIDGWDESYG